MSVPCVCVCVYVACSGAADPDGRRADAACRTARIADRRAVLPSLAPPRASATPVAATALPPAAARRHQVGSLAVGTKIEI